MYSRSAVFIAAFTILTSSGCTNRPANTPTIPVPVLENGTATSSTIVNSERTWTILPQTTSANYSSVLSASITQTDSDATRHDSLAVESSYSIMVARKSDSTVLTGSVRQFELRNGGKKTENQEQTRFPIQFSGTIDGQTITLVAENATSHNQRPCADVTATALTSVQHNLLQLPTELEKNKRWTDSLTTTNCAGTIPLLTTSIRNYRVVGEAQIDGIDAIVIDQTERTLSKGEGSQGQHHVLIDSQGNTNRRIYVDSQSGVLLDSKAFGKSSLVIQSSGKSQHFEQITSQITKRVQ